MPYMPMPTNDLSPSPLPTSLGRALLHPWTWRMAWRDSRAQRLRLVIFSLAIVSGLAALVAIHSLKASVQDGIATQAKALLGSDLQVSSRRGFSEEELARLTAPATRVARETSFSSMLYFPGADAARLAQVRGIEGGYPFYGKVATTPPDAWARLATEAGLVVEPSLLDQFNAKVGDAVKLGAVELPILGVVNKPAPRSSRFSGFAPEVYVRRAELDRTGLLGVSSLSFQLLHLELPATVDADALKRKLREEYETADWRIETTEDRRENLGDALDNFQQFLGLIALSALVLGAIGVAGAVHAHVTRRVPTVAILRCLGCPGALALGVYFAQAGALGLLGAGLGAGLGVALHLGVLTFFRDSLPLALDATPQWRAIALTSAAGFAVCCGFALLPLLKVRRISPAATLRGGARLDAPTGRAAWARAWPVYLLLTGLLVLLAVLNDSDWKRSLSLVGGLAAAFVALLGVARGLTHLARRVVRPSWPYLLRQGISNLHRPQNQTVLFLLSLGLGTFLLTTILLAGQLLQQRLSLTQHAESPTLYLVDVQPDQVEGVSALLEGQHLPQLEAAPMVTMRIESVKGVPIQEFSKQHGVPRWVARREFRSTYRDALNATETIVKGEWHATRPADPDAPVPLSLEEKLAQDLNVTVGDELTLDVQGVPVKTRVTSLRRVDWSRFNLNFFMVFTPGVLEDAPGFTVLTTRVPDGASSGALQRELAKEFPNVSAIDLTLILDTVRSILGQISRVVTLLGGVTLLAGLPILIGTLLNGRDLRRRESVLLRTLGASARQVRAILFVEYATLGALSAVTGLLLAALANVALALFVFKASPWPSPPLLGAAFLITTALAILGGFLLSRGVSRHPPLEVLRAEG